MTFYTILIFGIILDILSKNIASIYLQNKINILGDFFYLQYILNPGIAFGIKLPTFIIKVLTIFLIIVIFYYYKSERKKIQNTKLLDFSFGLILAGAIGNAIERILFSNVVDFLGIKYFFIFNLADSFISIGAILYIYILYKNNK
ncbi:signal peptidase II [Candidatus Gracilibacteria bacterium]|nr:signal peptidase II [Candidatus Gracilibacteria bacterium]